MSKETSVISSRKLFNTISAIYSIQCIPTGKLYVGSTVNIYRRWQRHRDELRHNYHPNRYLQSAWNKYGENNFTFSILEIVKNKDSLTLVEQKWINYFKSFNRENGFNLAAIAGTSFGCRHSYEARKKAGKLWIIKPPNKKPFKVRNLSLFCVENNIPLHNLFSVARGNSSNYKGWLCRDANLTKLDWKKLRKPKVVRSRYRLHTIKFFVCRKNGMNLQKVDNLSKFSDQNNLSRAKLTEVCYGKRKHHKGWVCSKTKKGLIKAVEYANSPHKVNPNIALKQSKTWKLTEPNGNIIIVNNLEKFCRENGFTPSGFRFVAYGERPHYKGWKCEQTMEESVNYIIEDIKLLTDRLKESK